MAKDKVSTLLDHDAHKALLLVKALNDEVKTISDCIRYLVNNQKDK